MAPANAAATARKPAIPEKYVMPKPPAVVIWRNCVGGEPSNAVVTLVGRSAISVMVFPPDSRVGTPKDGVRFVDDPQNKNNGNSDSGVWDYTDESKVIRLLLAEIQIPGPAGSGRPDTK